MTPEIRAFEYALGLFAVLIGLAVTDIANSLHRLLRRTREVRWDGLTVLAAGYALMMAVGMWFDLWSVRNVAEARRFFFYLVIMGEFFVLYLICAASLPDEPAERVDLRRHYEENRRYFWGLVALFQLSYLVLGIYFVSPLLARMPGGVAFRYYAQMSLLLALPLALASLRSRSLHFAGLALLYLVNAWHYAGYAIN
jgi:hypothetical protein